MADNEQPRLLEPGAPIPTVRIAQETPVIFADGVMSHSYAYGVSKIYLVRSDVDPSVSGPGQDVIAAQFIMPTDGFVRMTAFFEHRIKVMVEAGALKQEAVDKARQFWIDNPDLGKKNV